MCWQMKFTTISMKHTIENVITADHMVRDKFQKSTQVRSRIPSYYQTHI